MGWPRRLVGRATLRGKPRPGSGRLQRGRTRGHRGLPPETPSQVHGPLEPMRSLLFAVAYWLISIFYAFAATVLVMAPGRAPITWAVRRYSQRMIWALRVFAGV